MKSDASSMIRVAHTVCLTVIVTLVALVCIELWNYNDPDAMIEVRGGMFPNEETSVAYIRLYNTAERRVNFTFTLSLHDQVEVRTSSWNVSICSGSCFQYVLYLDAVEGLKSVNIQIHREGKEDPIRDVAYFVLDDEAIQA